MNSESSNKPGVENTSQSDFSQPSRGEGHSIKRVQLFRSGSFFFGIFESEIAAIADWREPTPLPYSPPAIRGVVSVQGRMLTVLDPSGLLSSSEQTTPQKILALRGEEQLALAIDQMDQVIEIRTGELTMSEDLPSLVLGATKHRAESCMILDSRRLFLSAIQGRDRRRRRF